MESYRKLKPSEMMIISRIFKKIELKKYLKELGTEFKNIKVSKKSEIQGELQKLMIPAFTDILGYILENIYIAENDINKLVCNICEVKDVDELIDVDHYTDVIIHIFKTSIPKSVKEFFDTSEMNEIKKKSKSN